jgi:hypothetical protein
MDAEVPMPAMEIKKYSYLRFAGLYELLTDMSTSVMLTGFRKYMNERHEQKYNHVKSVNV